MRACIEGAGDCPRAMAIEMIAKQTRENRRESGTKHALMAGILEYTIPHKSHDDRTTQPAQTKKRGMFRNFRRAYHNK